MKNIRSKVFETNSSSSHSLVITTQDSYYTQEEMLEGVYINDTGILNMWASSLEFYRSPFDVLCTFFDKARYAIAASHGELANEVETIFSKYIPGFISFHFDQRSTYVEDDFGEWVEDGWVNDYGGTDDYSIKAWLKEYDVTLEEFLTNRRYIVIVDGDEYCVWDHVKNSGIFRTDMILHDSYKEYQESLRKKYINKIEEEK